MQTKIYLNWEDVNILWEQVDMTWEEVYILQEIGAVIRRRGGGGDGALMDYIKGNPWDVTKKEIEKEVGEEKTKKFIKLVCRINGLDYEEATEPNSKVKVTVEQLEKVFNESIKVGVKI
jgi:hypothetical protein